MHWMRRGWRCAGWRYVGADGRPPLQLMMPLKPSARRGKIAPHAGVVKSVLRLFDELVKCDEEGLLKDVRKATEGI